MGFRTHMEHSFSLSFAYQPNLDSIFYFSGLIFLSWILFCNCVNCVNAFTWLQNQSYKTWTLKHFKVNMDLKYFKVNTDFITFCPWIFPFASLKKKNIQYHLKHSSLYSHCCKHDLPCWLMQTKEGWVHLVMNVKFIFILPQFPYYHHFFFFFSWHWVFHCCCWGLNAGPCACYHSSKPSAPFDIDFLERPASFPTDTSWRCLMVFTWSHCI